MNEGKIAVVITDDCSRFFKGDKLEIIKYIKSNNKYLARRVEGKIEGEIKVEDVEIIDADDTTHI